MGETTLGAVAAAAAGRRRRHGGGLREARLRRRDGGRRTTVRGELTSVRARRRRDRGTHLPVARLRRLPAPARPRRADHLPGHAPGPGERADPARTGTSCGTCRPTSCPGRSTWTCCAPRTGCGAPPAPPGKILDEVAAEVVVGFGGYVAVPAYLAAWRRELPTVIHEVNVPPGIANRLGMQLTPHVAVGFPHQRSRPGRCATPGWSGVPLRTRDRHAGPGGHARARRGRSSGCARTCRCCSCSARRRAPGRSTSRWPGRPGRSPQPGIQVLHIIGARNEDGDGPAGPAGAVRHPAVP